MKKLLLLLIVLTPFLGKSQENHQKDVYGSGCGFVGKDPTLRIKIENYLKVKNLKMINKWLDSDNLSQNTYAVEALIRLNNEGFLLSDHQKKQIVIIKNIRDKIWTCSGCIYSKQSVKDILFRYSLKDD